MKISRFTAIVCVMFLSGCAVTSLTHVDQLDQGTALRTFPNHDPLRKVITGASSQDVLMLAGETVLVGQNLKDYDSENNPRYEPIYINNPYRRDLFNHSRGKVQVDYYFYRTMKDDGVIEDNELMPVVFLNDAVIGKGWREWNVIIQEYGLDAL